MLALAGAGPWPHITSTFPLRTSLRRMGTSPPGPLRCGSTTCKVNAVATAASKALPPFSKVAMPTAVAIQWVEATTPKVPSISGRVVNGLGFMFFICGVRLPDVRCQVSGPDSCFLAPDSCYLIREIIVAAVVQILVQAPALDLIEHLVEFRARDGLVDEALAAAELAEVPGMVALELGRHRQLPERQIFVEVLVHRLLRAVECAQIREHHARIGRLRHPPQGVKGVLDDLAQAELLGHRDLRRQKACRLDLAVEQGLEPRTEAAGIDHLDVLERQIFFQPIGHVEMAAGAHAHRYGHVLQVLRTADI